MEQPGRSLLEAVHRAARGQLRHRLALAAVRRDDQPGEMAARDQVHGRRPAGHVQRGCPRVGHAPYPDRPPELDQERQRRVRTGSLDDQPLYDQRRRALGLVPQRDRSGIAAGRHFQPGRQLRQLLGRHQQPECGLHRPGRQLEGPEPADRRGVGRLRQRQDGDQGELRALRRRRGSRRWQHHRQQQPRGHGAHV